MKLKTRCDDFDVLISILVHLKKLYPNGEDIKLKNDISIHNILYNLSNNNKYKFIFKNYLFESHIGFYYSQKLEDYMDNMIISGMICTYYIGDNYFIKITEKSDLYFKKLILDNIILEGDNRLFKDIAKDVFNYITEENYVGNFI